MMDLTELRGMFNDLEMLLYPSPELFLFSNLLLGVVFCLHGVIVARNTD